MRFTGGWIKLHREILQKDIGENPILLALWVYLLAIANYKTSQIIWEGKQKILERGQLLLTIRELSEKWDCSPSTIHRWLHYLQTSNRIVIEARTRGTIITICNYEEFQENEKEIEHGPNTDRTRAEHGPNNSKESKKVRKKEISNVGIRLDYPQEFDAIWQIYGRRGDKKQAYIEFKKLELSEDGCQTLINAITAYLREAPNPTYRKHLSRFLKTDWRENLIPLENGHAKSSDNLFDFLPHRQEGNDHDQ